MQTTRPVLRAVVQDLAGAHLHFALDDLFDKIRGNGFDVRPIRKIRIGHDRRRVTVDEDGAVPFFAEDFFAVPFFAAFFAFFAAMLVS